MPHAEDLDDASRGVLKAVARGDVGAMVEARRRLAEAADVFVSYSPAVVRRGTLERWL